MRHLRTFKLPVLDRMDTGLHLIFIAGDLLRRLIGGNQFPVGIKYLDPSAVVDVLRLDISLIAIYDPCLLYTSRCV